MSPVDDGVKKVYRDKDSIFRDERGLLHMSHVTAFIAVLTGVGTVIAGLVAYFLVFDGAVSVVQTGLGVVASGATLEGVSTTVEGRNRRSSSEGGM